MALVTKNDVTQIFAIQAPSIDLPPTFANYPRGWDTARSNNGKPTIKQFNYIQQRTDQNVLWIHQNGAALPYDPTMEYAEGAPVMKDGELQKKQGASWVSATNKGYNLDYFVSGKSYPLHAEIMLTNGDTVKSTVANNSTNPNINMTGWVYTSQTLATNDYTTLAALSAKDGVIAFVKADGIAGEFRYDSASAATTNGGTIIASVNGGNWVRLFSGAVQSTWFSSLQSFVNYCITDKLHGHFVSGTNVVSDTLVVDFNLNREGFKFTGDSFRNSVIKRNDNGEVLRFKNTNSSNKDSFYGVFTDIGIEGTNDNGAVCNLGSPDLSDALNDCEIKIIVNNSSTSSNAVGCQINHVCNSKLFIVSNVSGFDKGLASLKVTQMQFCDLFGSFSNSNIGLYITGGYIFGNTIHAPDLEVVKTCLKIDVATATRNSIIGGQYDWWGADGYAIDITAGNSNTLVTPNLSGGSNGANPANIIKNINGASIDGQGTSFGHRYLPPTTFKDDAGNVTEIEIDSVLDAGVIFRQNGSPKFRLHHSGGNLVFQHFDTSDMSFHDDGYFNGSGIFTVNQMNALKFALNAAPQDRKTVTGSKGGNVALGSLLSALSDLGIITNSTT